MIRPDQRYPLTWPVGWRRTPVHARTYSQFKTTTDRAFRELLDELARLGARKVIVSSNLKLRNDGAPYANQPRTDDEGIAVYFQRDGKDLSLACDKFRKREDNLRAITKTIEALRGIERWGSSDLMERAFTGFAQLEAPTDIRRWWEVLGVTADAGFPEANHAYRRLRSKHHPDRGGDASEYHAVQMAWDQYLQEKEDSSAD
jgi:hypothetical protein